MGLQADAKRALRSLGCRHHTCQGHQTVLDLSIALHFWRVYHRHFLDGSLILRVKGCQLIALHQSFH